MAFTLDPELAHHLTLNSAAYLPYLASFLQDPLDNKTYALKLGPTTWSFPVGLAAGLDKNGHAIDFFSRLHFGAIEVGTVTPKPQDGNPKPRLFRYPHEESLRNCMGFNNAGAQVVHKNISAGKCSKVLGVNLGKNKVTPQEKAIEDYTHLYRIFSNTADYLVINVSSPNTPGLRDLAQKEFIRELFIELAKLRAHSSCPLFLKLSPDAEDSDLEDLVGLADEYKLTGLIATNTTVMSERGQGGISGKLLSKKARAVRRRVLELSSSTQLEVIGVGGISSFSDLVEFWKLGGKVCQIYTSFIYQGPQILTKIRNEIDECLGLYNAKNLEELLPQIITK